jgi:ribosomal protein RSM22 (predicted rRNA methylase)
MMGLPTTRINALLQGVSRKDLGRRVEKMSPGYRAGQSSVQVASREDALAYLVARAPATYAAAAQVLERVRVVLPDFAPQSLLDVGAGPGTASWAARSQWPGLAVTMLDQNPAFRALAAEIIDPPASIMPGDLGNLKTGADLVIANYVLAELPEASAGQTARLLLKAANAMLMLVEPGTPQGFARIRKARAALIEEGAHVVAPCTHTHECPIAAAKAHQVSDWCHFSVRLARSRAHMIAKGATVPFEDERYSYVVVSRAPVAHGAQARIIKPPLEARPGVTLPVCDHDGMLKNQFVARRGKEAYRVARKLEWGDLL